MKNQNTILVNDMLHEDLKKTNSAEYIFSKMLDAIPISLLMVNPDGVIHFANRFSEQLFGYNQCELVNKPIEMLVPERFRVKHPSMVQNYMRLPKIREMGFGRNLFGLRIDGTEVPIEIGLTPVRTSAGFFVLASIADITERVLVKEKLFAEEEHKKNLEIINNQLSEFAHIVSHDLTDSFLKLERLLPKINQSIIDPTEETEIAMKVSVEAVEKGKQLIEDLLNFAQASSLEVQEIDLKLVVSEVINTYNNCEVDFLVGDLHRIKGDKVLIRQIYVNLISNAVKYQKPNQKPLIEVGCNENVFFVKDNGIGVSEDNLVKLFKPFFRVSSKKEFRGSGLGLSICKKAVEAHGGKIWLKSKINEGTTAFFTLWS